ncbi:TRAP-type mannitol/chloroaromatic compound transport system, small permease component [Sulfitobacter brevis]|uniref:TRAP transporter small permease protein n=1 Tax=Sulfitobacter brevis TaxID=74348 RepID=A0A1I2BGG2_9RHOB|nr:TRAP transporter small permease subunit [Sulfitobacter brevis]SFE54373.1 TRAP-type mannitol/chloroaromatic compound transport system, small permease component [Sulfitobacter brevis]
MKRIAAVIDTVNDRIGRVICWGILLMVILQFAVVIARYVFSTSTLFGVPAVWLQEGVVYLHGITILLGTAYAMLWNKNVRVDILYEKASPRVQDLTEFLGSLFFVLPLCVVIGWSAMPNITMAWMVKEGSLEPNGIPLRYLLKGLVLAFCVLVSAQALSTMIKAFLRLTGRSTDPIYEASDEL